MKAYVLTTAIVFALITLAHIARAFVEGAHVLAEPIFLLFTVISVGFVGWATALLTKSAGSKQT